MKRASDCFKDYAGESRLHLALWALGIGPSVLGLEVPETVVSFRDGREWTDPGSRENGL